ncbi:gram domain-containing protein 1b [Limosa lapponica baueri]|uniref:Gram domain-containing protein 1b n=1 Tax=Limosa lapponica baueri TaxID=1758121 RepID=A0A2I0TSY4_LIMLA|nr:gram domain-containing protein 1b [Limosa lapponica baueri]
MRRMKNVQEQSLEVSRYQDSPSSSKEYLQLPSIEITPSSDEDTPWSNCSTPSASPRRKRFLLRKWLRVREKKEYSESSSQTFVKLPCETVVVKIKLIEFYQIDKRIVLDKMESLKTSEKLVKTKVVDEDIK